MKDSLWADDEPGLDLLKEKILAERGFNCRFYKDKCVQRRIAVRMRARGFQSVTDYTALLDQDAAEFDRLIDTLTINVTKFFRNPETWRAVADDVIPRLFATHRGSIDVWSAGCATGEEAYTLSILLHEWADREGRPEELERISITGTDIDRRSLAAAAMGEFPELSFEETPPDIRARWFTPSAPFRIHSRAKSPVSFRELDLITGEAIPGQSLIVCRNVIIYLEREVQERLFRKFHDSLRPGGVLVLGRVETLLGPSRALFRPLHTRDRIYCKPL
jgi:chemotaxis protein methyltransferase CheR